MTAVGTELPSHDVRSTAAFGGQSGHCGVPLSIAQKMQTLVPKDSTNPDQIVGMDSVMAEAVATKFLAAPLTKEQISELVQMKNPPKP